MRAVRPPMTPAAMIPALALDAGSEVEDDGLAVADVVVVED